MNHYLIIDRLCLTIKYKREKWKKKKRDEKVSRLIYRKMWVHAITNLVSVDRISASSYGYTLDGSSDTVKIKRILIFPTFTLYTIPHNLVPLATRLYM